VGTNDWTYVTLVFDSGDRKEVELGTRLGHNYSTATGTAWFDDLVLLEFPRGDSASGAEGRKGEKGDADQFGDASPAPTRETQKQAHFVQPIAPASSGHRLRLQWGKETPTKTKPDMKRLHIHDWLEAHVLRREAEEKLQPGRE
jgi:hypothetical protein